MFKNEQRKEAQKRLHCAVEEYQTACKDLQNAAKSLYQMRVERGVRTIRLCENYINTLANSPKNFDQAVAQLKFQLKEITGKDWELISKDPNLDFVVGTAGAGVMAGAGVACFGLAAAMAIATRLGRLGKK